MKQLCPNCGDDISLVTFHSCWPTVNRPTRFSFHDGEEEAMLREQVAALIQQNAEEYGRRIDAEARWEQHAKITREVAETERERWDGLHYLCVFCKGQHYHGPLQHKEDCPYIAARKLHGMEG